MHESFKEISDLVGDRAGRRAVERVDEYLKNARLVYPKYLDVDAAAVYTGFTPKALRDRIARGAGPVHHHVGRAIRFKREDLDAWVEQGACG